MVYLVNKSDIGHKRLKQKQSKNTQTIFVNPSKNSNEKDKNSVTT